MTSSLSPILPGDFNHDLVVDAADYVVWRDGLGSSYTLNDYNIWKANYGESVGPGSSAGLSVPEPLSVWLLAASAASCGLCRRVSSSIASNLCFGGWTGVAIKEFLI